jgi:hypothetical protein
MCYYFCVGIRVKLITKTFQLVLQFFVVFDDAVVNYGNGACSVGVRVGVLVVGNAVGGPASMADANGS